MKDENIEQDERKRGPDWYVAFAEQHEHALFGRGQLDALDALQAEHAGLLDALDESYYSDRAAGIRIGVAAWRFWLLRGHLTEGREKLIRLLDDRAEVPPQLRARGITVLGVIAFFQGDHAGARLHAEQSLGLAAEIDDPWSLAFSKTVLGWAAQAAGDYTAASSFFQESLILFKRMGHRWGEAVSLLNLGEVARSLGDTEAAEQFYLEDLAIYRELDEQSAIAATLCNLGYVALRRANTPSARDYFKETILLCQRLGNRQFAVGTFIGLAGVEAAEGYWAKAARLLGVADGVLKQIKGALEPADELERARVTATTRDALGERAFDSPWREGNAMSMN
ncbi:MAG TPA: tetratricopeptide repeat protein, partial [Pyrinomonadaceae bacterium]|nr:tetratricopeptide repeat protein [Pyrinomonadaceae bacterium]